MTEPNEKTPTRRELLAGGARLAGIGALGAVGLGLIATRTSEAETRNVWQIDPDKCIRCGKCATACVLDPSAVKCVHAFRICGYCKVCFGYFDPNLQAKTSAAENQRCPLGAITRNALEERPEQFEYLIDEDLCNGCGKCVEGCWMSGNGSLYLQVMHDRCRNCAECAIAVACPADAFVRRPIDDPYVLREPPTGGQE